MRWEGKEEGGGVEDRRGIKPGVAVGGGIGTIVLFIIGYLVTGDPNQAKNLAEKVAGQRNTQSREANPAEFDDRIRKFSDTMLGMNDRVWSEQLAKQGWGNRWKKPRFKLFSEQVTTGGCGTAPSAVGPFYCPADSTVYLDPTFFDELEQKLGGSKAEFSQAYVIAHEVGHHIQNLLGYNRRLQELEARVPARERENQGIRLELQADYLAGVWARHGEEKYKFLEDGDIDSAIRTAKSIGDDAIQKKTRGWTSPEKYNHGTSEQRLKYFMKGFKTGDASEGALNHFFREDIKARDL